MNKGKKGRAARQLRYMMKAFLRKQGTNPGDLGIKNKDFMQSIAVHFGVELAKTKARAEDQIRDLISRDRILDIDRPKIVEVNRVNKIYEGAKRRAEAPKKSFCPGPAFYQTDEWRALRYLALKRSNGRCQCCGRRPPLVVLHVDHVKPRSLYPDLELDINNLQVLCEDCNLGKSNKDETDWRPDTIKRRREAFVRELMQARYALEQERSEINYAWVRDVLDHLKQLDSHSDSPEQTGIGETVPVGQRTIN